MAYEVKNFCPNTGVGRFNAKLDGAVLKVTVKLHIVTSLTSTDQQDFTNLFEPIIKQHWEDQYGFRCSKPAFPNLVKPIFKIKYVNDMMDAHFVLNLLDGAGGTELVSRDTFWKVPKTHTGFAPTSVNLFTGSVQPTNSSGDILRDVKNSFPHYVDMFGTNPSPHGLKELKFLAKQLAGIAPTTHVKVTAYGNNKSQMRNNVIGVLRNCGLTNVTARISKKAVWTTSRSKSSNSTTYVKLSVDDIDDQAFNLASKPFFSYPAAAVHEFGHMLGLQDEYACLSKQAANRMAHFHFIEATEQDKWENFHPSTTGAVSAKVEAGQKEFIDYCHAAGVAPPHFGQHTISIMSSGSKFRPCHFVTLWAAITQMTGGLSAASDWTIEKL